MTITSYPIYLLLGILLGVLTGITPGLHFNNIAVLAYSFYLSFEHEGLVVLITSMMITHTFVDFIPSTFLGAPAEDTSLSVLPMHRMLLQGRGYRAVYLSTWGSLLAFLFVIPFIPLLFFAFIFFHGYDYLSSYLPVILLSIVLYMLYLESKKGLRSMGYASLIFLISGIFGLIALDFPQNLNFVPIKTFNSFLFPVFTGLFGIPVLILSRHTEIPSQKIERVKMDKEKYMAALAGTTAGAFVGFLPGVTSGIAAVIARGFSTSKGEENYIVSLGSVNTANYLFNILFLFLILKPRSFAVGIIARIMPVEKWSIFLFPPSQLILILITSGLASFSAFFLTLLLGKLFALGFGKIGRKYSWLNRVILISLILLLFLFSGIFGLLLALIATLIGLLPPKLGTMRVHLMGVLLLPLIIRAVAWI